MARFYKTASATPLDYMYKLNVPLMERVIKANDTFVNQRLATTEQQRVLGTTFAHDIDDEQDAKRIADQYSTKADDIVKAMLVDPANWRKQQEPIRALSRDIQTDYKTGEISKIIQTHGEFKAVNDAIDEQVKEYAKTGKGLDPNEARAYKGYMRDKYREKAAARGRVGTGYDPATGEYTGTAGALFTPMAKIDIRGEISKELEKIKADSKKYKRSAVTGEEFYFDDKTEKWKGVTPERLLAIAAGRLTDPLYQNYMRERQTVGLMQGVFDEQGNYIAPYSYGAVDVSPTEKKNIDNLKGMIAKEKKPAIKAELQTKLDQYEADLKERTKVNWNEKSSLAPMVQSLLGQYSWSETEDLQELRNNAAGSTKYLEYGRNKRFGAGLQNAMDIAKLNIAAREKIHNDNLELNWSREVRLGGTRPEVALPDQSSVSRLATGSFAEKKTTDRKTGLQVDAFSNAGLSSDIMNKKDQIAGINKELKDIQAQEAMLLGNRREADLNVNERNTYNNLKLRKQDLQQQLPTIQSDLDRTRQWYGRTTEPVLANNEKTMVTGDKPLTQREIDIYKKYENDRDAIALSESLAGTAQDSPFASGGAYANKMTKWFADWQKIGTPEHRKKKDELTEYMAVKNKVDKRRDNVMNDMKYQVIDTPSILLSKEDSKAIGSIVFANTQGMKLFTNRGINPGGAELKGKNGTYNVTLDNVGGKNLQQYIVDENVETKFEMVGNTTNIGTGGAMVKVTFKDPNGKLNTSPYYIELTPEVQKIVGQRMMMDKSPDVREIAGSLMDDESNDIRRQLMIPSMQKTLETTGTKDSNTYGISIKNGDRNIPLTITSYRGEDGQEHIIARRTLGGELIALGDPAKGQLRDRDAMPKSGIPGVFNGKEDLIEYLKQQRARMR